ncbi:MAG: Holliday junction branch migration protein RuvA [Roseiflexaceae bacterium]
MIATLRGILLATAADHAIIETGGIGWLVYLPRQVVAGLGTLGSEVRLFTHLQVREDAMTLYGFATAEQRQLFETLLGVSGVGPKVALSLLGANTPDELKASIAAGDVTRLARTPGIGKKTAERLVLELKGKIDLRGVAVPSGATPAQAALNADLAELLTNLGFSAIEANRAIAALPADAPADLEERLRLALRYFGSA